MHNLQNGKYNFFPGIHLRMSIFVLWRFTPRLSLIANRNFAAIEPGIFATENGMYVTIVLGIFVLENYNWPFPMNDPVWWADTPNLLEKTKSTVLRVAKIHTLQCKENFIENHF